MNAVTKWSRWINTVIADVRFGVSEGQRAGFIDEYEIEPDDCPKWIDEEGDGYVWRAMLDALPDYTLPLATDKDQDAKRARGERMDRLTRKLMKGDMSIDELCEWRDIQRSALMDLCSYQVRERLKQEFSL